MDLTFSVYILASAPYGTLYCGHTDYLARRIWQHREEHFRGFTRRHGVHRLVWYENGDSREGVLVRERQIKKWNRAWKIRLIEAMNPQWLDLYETLNC